MKRFWMIVLALTVALSGCGRAGDTVAETAAGTTAAATAASEASGAPIVPQIGEGAVRITLDNGSVAVDYPEGFGEDAVRIGNDIVYYKEGMDETYGEGTEADAHCAEAAAEHTVVTIAQPGVYVLSGSSDAAQVAVDLGENARNDPRAVVTLVLDGLDLTCSVAPAILFYHVYECGSPETASQSVDTSTAGANLYIADGSTNIINGSYVARIYDPDTVATGEEASYGTLHKYDAAIWSQMSMNVTGNSGVLNINAENEGLGSGLHLTVNGGSINIVSGNDGINTNYDGASVTTVNGGRLNITVSGETGEGDGIDSNGWLVINGGTVVAAACGSSEDAGIDADLGIRINGGTVIATGNMLDPIDDAERNFAVFRFAEKQTGGSTFTLKNADAKPVINTSPVNDFTVLILAGEGLAEGDYTFWRSLTQLSGTPGQAMMGGGGARPPMELPEGAEPPEMPGEVPQPEGRPKPPRGEKPQDSPPPEGMDQPTEMIPPEEMDFPDDGGFDQFGAQPSEIFTIAAGGNYFSGVSDVTDG